MVELCCSSSVTGLFVSKAVFFFGDPVDVVVVEVLELKNASSVAAPKGDESDIDHLVYNILLFPIENIVSVDASIDKFQPVDIHQAYHGIDM